MATQKEIIKEWEMVKLVDVCDLNMGQSPDSKFYNSKGEGLPFFQGKTDFGFKHPSLRIYCSVPKKIVVPGDILISVRAPVGPVNIANVRSCIGRGIGGLRAKPDKLDQTFLYFYLILNEKAIASLGSGSTFHAINKSHLENFELYLPPLDEQKAIARVLNTVQEAIAGQEALIAKLKELKRSMMHHLFTHGTKGEKTKMTEIGEIPESWDMIKFEDCLQKIKPGKSKQIPLKEYKMSGKFPIVDQGKNAIAGYTDKEDKVIFDNLPIIIFGDHTRIIKFIDFPFSCGADGTKLIKPKSNLFNDKFFFYQMLNLEIPSRGYNRHYLILKEKKIAKPNINEQNRISNILTTIDHKIETVQLKLSIYQNLFKTLLHELMSGKRRVRRIRNYD